MRPKKRVLLIDWLMVRRGVTGFMLRTNNLTVLSAADPWEAAGLVAGGVDVIVGVWPIATEAFEKLVGLASLVGPGVRSILVAETLTTRPDDLMVDCALFGQVSSLELLERIRTLSARKRGPRKGVWSHADGKCERKQVSAASQFVVLSSQSGL
jgi:hypothetical protein